MIFGGIAYEIRPQREENHAGTYLLPRQSRTSAAQRRGQSASRINKRQGIKRPADSVHLWADIRGNTTLAVAPVGVIYCAVPSGHDAFKTAPTRHQSATDQQRGNRHGKPPYNAPPQNR